MLFTHRLIAQLVTILLLTTLFAATSAHARGKMTQKKMEKIVTDMASDSEGVPGNIQFIYNGVQMAIISNVEHNRMRIVAPIIEASRLEDKHLFATLISNFHLALDARYALGSNLLFSVYIHPLKELTRDQIESAVRQVATLQQTFGGEYTSGQLSYGAPTSQGEDI